MRGPKIHFKGVIWKIIFELSSIPLLYGFADHVDPGRNEGSVLGFTGQAFDTDWLLRICAICRHIPKSFMSHLIKIYVVCSFSYFCLWYLKS